MPNPSLEHASPNKRVKNFLLFKTIDFFILIIFQGKTCVYIISSLQDWNQSLCQGQAMDGQI
jgi:hypothetical protein